MSNVHLWTPTHGNISVGQPAKAYNYQLCADTGCRLAEQCPIGSAGKGFKGVYVVSTQWWWYLYLLIHYFK